MIFGKDRASSPLRPGLRFSVHTGLNSTQYDDHKFVRANALMDRFQQLCRWLTSHARFLGTNTELFEQFCSKVGALAVPLDRSWLHIRTLHPQYGGLSRLWRRDTEIVERYLEHDFESKSIY